MTEVELSEVLATLGEMRASLDGHVKENTDAHASMNKAVMRVSGELERHGNEERRMRVHMFGNGDVGLMESMREIQRFQASVRRMLWILVPAVAIGALGMVGNALAWYVGEGGTQ